MLTSSDLKLVEEIARRSMAGAAVLSPDSPAGQVMQVRVTNHNDFPIRDMFDGIPYVIDAGRTEAIPSDAAHHIFGFFPGVDPRAMALHIQKRFGWNTPDMVKNGAGEKYLSKIKIEPVMFKLVPVETDTPEQAEAKAGEKREVRRLYDQIGPQHKKPAETKNGDSDKGLTN